MDPILKDQAAAGPDAADARVGWCLPGFGPRDLPREAARDSHSPDPGGGSWIRSDHSTVSAGENQAFPFHLQVLIRKQPSVLIHRQIGGLNPAGSTASSAVERWSRVQSVAAARYGAVSEPAALAFRRSGKACNLSDRSGQRCRRANATSTAASPDPTTQNGAASPLRIA